MKKTISIIIPCYNSGEYISDAISSIEKCTDKANKEVIIVDDGSFEQQTLDILDVLKKTYKVIHQENKGPAAARNAGVKASDTPYILFLDSDNKINSTLIDKAIKVLEDNKDIGVVYSDVSFFGESENPRFSPCVFDFEKLLARNYLDMCAIIKRQVWEDLGGLDEHPIIFGIEDWDFWLRIGKTKWNFHFINEKLYDYRIRKESLIQTLGNSERHLKSIAYVYSKHIDQLAISFPKAYSQLEFYIKDKNRPFRSFIKFFYHKYIVVNKTN